MTALDIAGAPGGRVALLRGAEERLRLLLLLPEGEMDVGAVVGRHACRGDTGAGNWVDLETGEIVSCGWRKDGGRAVLEPAVTCAVPSLLIAHR